jgi:hypothetical protein
LFLFEIVHMEGNIIFIDNRKNEIRRIVFVTPTSPQDHHGMRNEDYGLKAFVSTREEAPLAAVIQSNYSSQQLFTINAGKAVAHTQCVSGGDSEK